RSGAGSPGRPRPWLRRGSLWLSWRPQYAPMYRGARRYEARAPPPAAPFIIPAEDPYRARWAPEAGGRATVSAQEDVELVRRGYEAFIAGDMVWLDEHFHENIVWHVPGHNLLSGTHRSRDNVMAFLLRSVKIALPEF